MTFDIGNGFRCFAARTSSVSLLCLAGAGLDAASFPLLTDGTSTAPNFHLGGAVRFNYGWRDNGVSSKFQPELVRLDASGQYGRLFGNSQYRWYDGFDAVHHA